jgi:hypothetical protein
VCGRYYELVQSKFHWSAAIKAFSSSTNPTSPSILFQKQYFPIGGNDLHFDQPWALTDVPTISKFSDLETGARFIIGELAYSPGLGNLMFEFAALHYYAERHNATIVLPSNCLLRRAFGKLRRTIFMSNLDAYLLYFAEQDVPIHEYKVCLNLKE